jgi:hypothetical protein
MASSTARALASSGAPATSRSISSPALPVPTSSSATFEALGAQPAEAPEHGDGAPAEALRDLHDDAARLDPRLGDRAQQPVVVGVEVERLRGDVEEQQRAAHAQRVEVVDAADLLGDVEGLGRAR